MADLQESTVYVDHSIAIFISEMFTYSVPYLKGGDFSLPDYDLRTPLHLACSQGNYDAVKMLLEHGASVHSKDRFGHTPLIDAVRFKYVR